MVRRHRPSSVEEFVEVNDAGQPIAVAASPVALVPSSPAPVASPEPDEEDDDEEAEAPAPEPIAPRVAVKPAKKLKTGRRQDVGENFEKCTVNFRTTVIEKLRITAVMKRRSQVAIIEEALDLWYAAEEKREKKALPRS